MSRATLRREPRPVEFAFERRAGKHRGARGGARLRMTGSRILTFEEARELGRDHKAVRKARKAAASA